MSFTKEQLLTAIREADNLKELQRMVGPSEEASQRNKSRAEKLKHYFEQYGTWGGDNWPEHAKELLVEQLKFEAVYF